LVVSDGGADLVPSLTQAYPRARHQRCEWHLVYSLGHFLWFIRDFRDEWR
jgi:transposase-like protein